MALVNFAICLPTICQIVAGDLVEHDFDKDRSSGNENSNVD
jgi:hypothetical protein